MYHAAKMRFGLALALLSCGAPQPLPSGAPQPATLPPPPPIASAAPLPSTLIAPYGVESREQHPGFSPAKGTIAASCRGQDGVLADAVSPDSVPRAFTSCKAPAGSRFVIRLESSKKGNTVRGIVDREGADEKIAKCVQDAIPKSGLTFEPIADDKVRSYDCYVAFY